MQPSGTIDVSPIRGVVFDLDGTLVQSRLDFDAIRRETGFPTGIGLLEHLATLADTTQAQRAAGIIYRHEMAGAARATWMPGARRLLTTLHTLGIPTAILTRNMRDATHLTMRSLAIPIDLVLTREDCSPKPDPEGLLHIARQWNLPTHDMVYIGDFHFDIQAAHNARMRACLYRRQSYPESAVAPDWVIDHFDQLSQAFTGCAERD